MGWCVDYGVRDGKRRREYYLDKAKAESALTKGLKDKAELGRRWASLPPVQRLDVVELLTEIEGRGLTLREVWNAYQDGRTFATTGKITVRDAIAALVTTKTKANKRPAYIASLEQYLKAWAKGFEERPIAGVEYEELKTFVDGKENLSSRSTAINRLSTLFSYAVRQGWIIANPIKRLERPTIEDKAPEIMTLAEVRQVLGYTKAKLPRFIPWLALTLFAGLRPEEADKITRDKIDLKAGTVTIDAAVSKVRNLRVVNLKPVAVKWLKRGGDLPLPKVTRRRAIRKLRELLGWPEWKKDVLRHTCASNWIAEGEGYGTVALELGNSEAMLRKHYKTHVSKAESAEFWALNPKAVK